MLTPQLMISLVASLWLSRAIYPDLGKKHRHGSATADVAACCVSHAHSHPLPSFEPQQCAVVMVAQTALQGLPFELGV